MKLRAPAGFARKTPRCSLARAGCSATSSTKPCQYCRRPFCQHHAKGFCDHAEVVCCKCARTRPFAPRKPV